MEANKTHISLKTAKLLKDCKIQSELYQYRKDSLSMNNFECSPVWLPQEKDSIIYPAYTWQEILWEFPKEFFGEIKVFSEYLSDNDCPIYQPRYMKCCEYIITWLQRGEYEKADKFFRKNCTFI